MGITTALNLQWVVCAPTKAIMNKFLAVFCLAATVSGAPNAEADPALLYNTYGYGLGAYGYAGYPYAAYAPAVTGYSQVSPSASLTTAGLGLANAAVPAVAGGYAGAGRYIANSAGVVHVAKREAEAEADAQADPALFYSHYGYGLPAYTGYSAYHGLAGYPYTYGAYPYNYGLGYSHYAAPAVAAPVATGYAQVSPSASLTTVGLADASIPAVAGGYAGAGRYVANSAGVVHVA